MITTFGSPAAAETDGTIMPRVATKARASANADVRKLDSESRRGAMYLVRLAVLHGRLNRGMVPKPLAPSGRPRWDLCGLVWSGSVAVGAHPFQQIHERWVGAVTLGQDRPSVRGPRERRPVDRDGRIVPGEAELVGAVVLVGHQVDELERV